MNRYTTQSQEFISRLNQSLAGGMGSGGRLAHRNLFIRSGEGARVTDVDGNEYIDYMMGFGALILGHRPPELLAAVKDNMKSGTMFGAACEAELMLSEKIISCIPCVERVRFTSSGTEAVQAAIRLARAATGRDKILKFEGHFHGWADNVYISVKPLSGYGSEHFPNSVPMTCGQPQSVLEDIFIAPWNNLSYLRAILEKHGKEVAAILLEPYPTNNGCMDSGADYLKALRELCKDYGIILIFDEVVSGFRMSLGGAQEYYGVLPDLCTFGKAMAGGMPIAGFGGKAEIMNLLKENQVSHLGTYNSNPICASASLAVLNELSDKNGMVFEQIKNYGRKLIHEMEQIFQTHKLPFCVSGHGSVFTIFPSAIPPKNYRETLSFPTKPLEIFVKILLEEGIWIFGRGNLMISRAHTCKDLNETLEKIEKTAKKFKLHL